MAIANRTMAVLSDLTVLALTWVRTAGLWKESLKLKGSAPALSEIVLRNGRFFVVFKSYNF